MSREPLWRSLQASLLAGEAVALATVVNRRGSAPRPEGASLLVRADGSLLGAVSAGCLETDVVRHALQVLATGKPERHRYQATSGDDPLSFGLSCGGSLELVIERWSPAQLPLLEPLFTALANDEPVLLATCLEAPGQLGVRTARSCQSDLPTAAHTQLITTALSTGAAGAGHPWPAGASISRADDGSTTVLREHQPATPR